MQTKRQSLLEAIVNLVIGYAIVIGSQFIIFPRFGVHISFTDNLHMGLYFMVISLTRTYFIRRFYNWKHRGAE